MPARKPSVADPSNKHATPKQTGPRTATGKATSSQNALKHGMRAAALVLPFEDPAEYEQFITETVKSLNPVGAFETELARQVATAAWKLRRTEIWEAARARLVTQEDSDNLNTRLAALDAQIDKLRSEQGALQTDPASNPPLLAGLAAMRTDATVDSLEVEMLWEDFAERLPVPEEAPGIGTLCDRAGLPEAAASEPNDWPGWTAAHVRLLVAEFAKELGMTLEAYLKQAEEPWRAGIQDERIRRKHRRAELKRDIRAIEMRKADLIRDRTAPEALRLDLYARYSSASMRTFEKLLKILHALQDRRRGNRTPAKTKNVD